MRITNKLSIITTTIALSALSLTPAHAAQNPVERETASESISITANPAVKLSYERPSVKVTEAPVLPETPAFAPQVAAPVLVAQTSTVSTPVAPATTTPAPVASAVTDTVSDSGRGAAIAAAALAQIGVPQDCTRLVTRSIAAAGINFHGWPAEYLSLGSIVSASQAQAGDLIFYPNGGMGVPHIAVYVGGGMAVHGGWNGGTTALASANVGSGATFIRV